MRRVAPEKLLPLARLRHSFKVAAATLALLGFCVATTAFAVDFTGQVVGVTDGDTLTVLPNRVGERIRLHGIDCPEKGQAFGQRAKQLTSELAFGKEVTIKAFGQEKYGRTIGDVILHDGRNLNHELVGAGMCWWYRKYAPGDVTLERLETAAR